MKKVLMFTFAAAILAASIGVGERPAARRDQHRRLLHGVSVCNRGGGTVRQGRLLQDPEDRVHRHRRRVQALLRGRWSSTSGHFECLSGHQGFRVRGLSEERRYGHRRSQDRLRRHRGGQFQKSATAEADHQGYLSGAGQGSPGPQGRRKPGGQPLQDLEGCQRIPSGHEDRGARSRRRPPAPGTPSWNWPWNRAP